MVVGAKLRCSLVLGTAIILFTLCGCQGLLQSPTSSSPPPPPPSDLTSIKHIVVMVQENRSFDTYLGHLSEYWSANGYPPQKFDGMPTNASNSGFNGAPEVSAYHVATVCIENLSPFWNESHLDWNLNDPGSSTAKMNGFVWNAANFATNENASGASPQFTDTAGVRAMGYYDGSDLNYYYFMASNFATSDRWFAPAMDRTQVNRLYLYAATSQGYVYPPGTDAADNAPLTAFTIFDALNVAGISWKIYYTDDICTTAPPQSQTPVSAQPKSTSSSSGACTYLTQFAGYAPPNSLPSNVVPVSQYLADVKAGTLPAVAFIEPGFMSKQDEHPAPDTDVQTGAAYVESLINPLMNGPSWKDSVFILTYDEPGGFYDHVAPQAEPNPDGIAPVDLQTGDVCTVGGGANCNFNTTGFRVPLIVISPFTKKNYVSHTVADY